MKSIIILPSLNRSVLRPPVPVEEYFRDQRQLQAITTTETQVDTRTIKSANPVETTSSQPQAFWPQQPSIRDLDSLRTLLPRSQQHLLGKFHLSRNSLYDNLNIFVLTFYM